MSEFNFKGGCEINGCVQAFLCGNCVEAWACQVKYEATTKKVERLEKAIWEYEHVEFSSSPKLIQEYLDKIYTGKLDERFDKAIKECKKAWE